MAVRERGATGPSLAWTAVLASACVVAGAARWILARADGARNDEERLARLARRDPLTGISNRIVLRDRLEHAIDQTGRTGRRVGVLFIDVDRFKDLNDQFGHDVGDEVLRVIARRLESVSRRGDTVGRLGGDEFTLILENLDDATGAATVAQKVLDVMEEPIDAAGRMLAVSVSIGVALTPDDGEDAATLLQHADRAMYAAKSAGRHRFTLSTSSLREANLARVDLLKGLRAAIEQQALRLVYQPQVDLRTDEVVVAEALVRWVLEDGTEVPAAAFIEVAEETELMRPLTDWVLRRACQDAASWSGSALGATRVAVNLSPSQFAREGMHHVVAAALAGAGLEPGRFEVEVTERALAERPDRALEVVRGLDDLGVTVAVDDFGLGHSSLRHLERFPLHVLKIAEEFVSDHGTPVPEVIVDLARRFGLQTVAEGVERPEQRLRFEQMGCDRIQGYLVSRPLTADALLEWADEPRLNLRGDAAG